MPAMDEGSTHGQWSAALLVLSSVALAWQMFAFISEHAVNILFWDLWDIYPVLFEERSLWDLVRHQVGKTRQGPGFLLTWLVSDVTSMNTRAESFAIGGVFCLALAAAIWLKRLITGRLHLTDAMLPLIVLTSVQQDTWVGVPNLSVGASPLLLIVLLCLGWMIPNVAWRVAAVVVFNMLLVNSGYGLIAAPLAPALFTITWVQAASRGDRPQAVWAVAGLAGSLAAVALFLRGWVLNFGGECSLSGSLDQLLLPGFVVLMLGKFVGLDFDQFGLVSTLVGTALFFAMLEALVRHGRRLIAGEGGPSRASTVVVTLIGFSVLYAFMTAWGRMCESLLVGQASRYMTFLIPAFVGLYIDLLSREGLRWRRPALAVLFAGSLVGAFSVVLITDDGAARISDAKRRWKACYLRTEDVARCDSETLSRVYPWDPQIVLPPKLEYLKAHRLNLYADR